MCPVDASSTKNGSAPFLPVPLRLQNPGSNRVFGQHGWALQRHTQHEPPWGGFAESLQKKVFAASQNCAKAQGDLHIRARCNRWCSSSRTMSQTRISKVHALKRIREDVREGELAPFLVSARGFFVSVFVTWFWRRNTICGTSPECAGFPVLLRNFETPQTHSFEGIPPPALPNPPQGSSC